jgi:hypothetical protein
MKVVVLLLILLITNATIPCKRIREKEIGYSLAQRSNCSLYKISCLFRFMYKIWVVVRLGSIFELELRINEAIWISGAIPVPPATRLIWFQRPTIIWLPCTFRGGLSLASLWRVNRWNYKFFRESSTFFLQCIYGSNSSIVHLNLNPNHARGRNTWTSQFQDPMIHQTSPFHSLHSACTMRPF